MRARFARQENADDWREKWALALALCAEYFSTIDPEWEGPPGETEEASDLLRDTANMIRDEDAGVKAHFWNRGRGRPRSSQTALGLHLAVVTLVAAVREKIKREGLDTDAIAMAQTALRAKGVKMSGSQIESYLANVRRLPDWHTKYYRDHLEWLASGEIPYTAYINFAATIAAERSS